MTILDEILSRREIQTTSNKRSRGINSLSGAIKAVNSSGKVALIAEIKPKSPSVGTLASSVNLEEIATLYEINGATCISILTEKNYFGGKLENISKIAAVTDIPLFRKDFITTLEELETTFHSNADAVLLMVSILGTKLNQYLKKCQDLGLESIVEIHTEKELDIALDAGAKIIGINNRNLRTLEVNLEITKNLARKVPEDVLLISESGISSSNDIEELVQYGIHAVLVGTTIMKSANKALTIQQLAGVNLHA